MHELGIVFHIIRTVEDVAKENHVARIQRVTLQLGEVSGADRGADPRHYPVRRLRPAVPHRAPWPHLPPLPKPPYPPAAGQRDYDQRSGSRGAGDIRSFRLRKIPRTGCVMRPCAGIFLYLRVLYAILETGIVKTERMNHSPCGRSTLNTAALHKTS